MAKEINVLIVVDCDAILRDGAVSRHLFMVDDQGRLSSGQGTSCLTTGCVPDDTINFRIAGIRPTDNPRLTKFVYRGGDMICDPIYDQLKRAWSGDVTGTGKEIYDWIITIGNREFGWDPYIESKNPTV